MPARVIRSRECIGCGFCAHRVACPTGQEGCIGCGNCVKGCPSAARVLTELDAGRASIRVRVDGEVHSVPAGASLSRALRLLGKGCDPARECGTGGCWACGVLVDGRVGSACSIEARDGMEVVTSTEALAAIPAVRIVSFFPGHLHASMSVFTHGCNYACSFCHNWDLTFSSADQPIAAAQAVELTRRLTARSGNRWTGISGGEPTLNRRWLVEYVGGLKASCPGVRIQVDTNASLLTPDYIDELWEAGMTDISPDLKGLGLATFQRITGISDQALAARHHDASWAAVEYALSRYAGRLHMAVGIPYHPSLITAEEIRRMGERLATMQPDLDVNLIVYRPAFRMRHAPPAADEGIDLAVELLESTGVTVWCQEGDHVPPATSPEQSVAASDEVF